MCYPEYTQIHDAPQKNGLNQKGCLTVISVDHNTTLEKLRYKHGLRVGSEKGEG